MPRRLPALGLAVFLLAVPAVAQTSGTYIVTGSTNWSAAASWSPAVPDGGGTATFNDRTGQVSGFTVTIDATSRTLGGIVFNSGFSTTIAASGGANLIIPATGLTINSQASLIGSPSTATFNGLNPISAPISGSGPLTKTGFGSVTLSGANTFTGEVRLNQGNLNLTAGDTSLGNTDNDLFFDGGTVTTSTAVWTSPATRTINIAAGGAYLRGFTATTLNGPLAGAGPLVGQINTGALTLTADSPTFSGAVRAESRQIVLSGNGRLGAGGTVETGSIVTLSNAATALANRLGGRAVVQRGAQVVMAGNAAAGVTEAAGNLSVTQGMATFTLTPDAATPQATVFSATGLTRTNRGTLFVRGTGLGTGPTSAAVANFVVAASPGEVVGGGGDPTASVTASVLPFAFGNTAAANLNDSVHLSYDSATGRLVPLNAATGYAADTLATSAGTDNVSQGASVTLGGAAAANALRLAPAASILIDGPGPLTVASGAVLSTSPAATVPTVTIAAPLTAGARELVLVSTNGNPFLGTPTGLVVSGAIGGTGGLTRSGTGGLVLSGASSYTGPTTFAAGTTVLTGPALTLTGDGSAASVLGQGTDPIAINGGAAATTRVYAAGALVVNRGVTALLGGNAGLGTANAASSVTLNGGLALTDPNPYSQPASPAPGQAFTFSGLFFLEGGSTPSTAVTINGMVSGSGGLRAGPLAYTVLNNTNTYTGATVLGTTAGQTGTGPTAQAVAETFEVGADNAFGTGTVYVQTATPTATPTVQPLPAYGTIVTAGAARALGNPVVLVNGYGTFAGTAPLTLNGPLELGGSSTNNSVLTVGSGGLTVNGVVSRGGLIKNGPGPLTLTNANQNGGQVSVRQGTLTVASIGAAGVFGNLGGAPAAATYLTLSGNAVGDTGTLRYTGAGEATNRLFSLTGSGGALDASGTNPLQFTNTGTVSGNALPGSGGGFTGLAVQPGQAIFTVSTTNAIGIVVGSGVSSLTTAGLFPANTTVTEVGPNYFRTSAASTNPGALTGQSIQLAAPPALTARTLTLTGSNTGLNTLSGVLTNTGFQLAVAKTGDGTWVLTNSNSYQGGTTVSAGRLFVNGSVVGSGTGTGPVTVTGGTFGGSGRAAGAVTVGSAGTLAPGQGGTGTLVVGGNVTLASGAGFRVGIQAGAVTAAADSGGSAAPGVGNTLLDLGTGANVFNLTNPRVVVDVTGLTFTPDAPYSFKVGQGQATVSGVGTTSPVAGATFEFRDGASDVTGLYQGGGGPTFTFSGSLNSLYLNFTPVPEPAAVLAVAGLGLAALRRRAVVRRVAVG